MPKSTINSNESKICDAIVKLLEKRFGCLQSISLPEDDQSGPPVERLLSFPKKQVALEHTVLESFAGQIHSNSIASQLENLLKSRFETFSQNVQGTYYLSLPHDLSPISDKDKAENFAVKLGTWVNREAANLLNNPKSDN